MARPRSDDKRDAILAAAIQVIAAQGLSAPTAMIASEAGVSNGSLFTYFKTKSDLLNHLYCDLKTEMAAVAMEGLNPKHDLRAQSLHMWNHTLQWAAAYPEKRRVLAHLGVSDDITPASREAGHKAMAPIARLLDQSRKDGAMRKAPLDFVAGLMSALTDATADFMIRDPANASKHCKAGFEALWRMVA
jgi:AcrR family transcriptional regulator